jgi:hypothetical protein
MISVVFFLPLLSFARFGAQEQFFPAIAARITALCPLSTDNTGLCPTLRGDSIVTVLANAGACDQQRHADLLVDFAKNFFPGNKTNEDLFIKIAQDFRTMERNTNENGKCSPICTETPRNIELVGLTQAQDPGCCNPLNTGLVCDEDKRHENRTKTSKTRSKSNGRGRGNRNGFRTKSKSVKTVTETVSVTVTETVTVDPVVSPTI